MKKLLVGLLSMTMVLAACGPQEEPRYGQVTRDMPGGFDLPAPEAALPTFVLFPRHRLTAENIRRVSNLDQVVAAAPLRVTQVEIEGPNGAVPLQLGSTPPLDFRAVAPAPTRDADFVWTSLIGGRAVVTYEAAEELGVQGADPLTIPGVDGVRVGAFAENGAPTNFADVLVSEEVIDRMPGEPIDMLIVGTGQGTDAVALGRSLRKAVPEARLLPLVQVLEAGPIAANAAPTPLPQGSAELGLGGTMNFKILEDGWIEPDESWVQANLTQAEVPILGTVTCHRVMIPQLLGALSEIDQAGLDSLIRPEDYAGCYAPRFIDRDPDLPLSNHAFGLAIDLNSDTNRLGTRGDMDPRIVEIFERWGFEWGGRGERPDPMHFELARLLPQ